METNNNNPFFYDYNTPHDTFPFDKITNEHFEPAILKGIKIQEEEINNITSNPEEPTFKNTLLPFERSGKLLNDVTNVFFNLLSANTNDEMQLLAQKLTPILNEHQNSIGLNLELFNRIKKIYQNKDKEDLNKEQHKLLKNAYEGFVRNGANLNDEDKKKYKSLTNELSLLSLNYSENNLKEINSYKLNITDEKELEGIPENIVESAKETAKEKGDKGWNFSLSAPSFIPFMKYAKNRELRKELYLASCSKGTHAEYNNIGNVIEIANKKMQIAQLLGYKNYASYALEKRMAKDSEEIYTLLNELLVAYKPQASKEVEEIQELAKELEGNEFKLMPWDFAYYANLLKEKKYSFNDELLRPYFELKEVISGVFGLASKLYGISFKENKDIPVYHKDVKAYDVFDKDGSFLAVLYTDFFPRDGKRSGAWMTSFKEQSKDEESNSQQRPHVMIVMNFTKPTQNKPSLLTFDEVNTFLHEFGHSLHGIFANSTYESLSGTNVYWDFVELPSQIMENFATEIDFLNTFAKHYETQENIPTELVTKIKKAANFNVAYACIRQVSFGLLDMAWYTREEEFSGSVKNYEDNAWKETQLLPKVKEACMSTQFSHIFAGGYSAGYYSYKWAEILDADAFALFKEKGIFNQEVAQKFRDEILSRGGTEDPALLYKNFRGKKATIDALLRRDEIKK